MKMGKLKGIVLYDIQMDRSLSGVYTNNHPQVWGTILPESARYVTNHPNSEDGSLVEEYESFYFDFPNGGVQCTLMLYVNSTVYRAEWILNGKIIFKGDGFKMNDRQIAISYWTVE